MNNLSMPRAVGITLLVSGLFVSCSAENPGSGQLPARIVLPDEVGVPEGIAFDDARRRFIVSSLANGALRTVELDGTVAVLAHPGPGTWSTLGMHIDSQDDTLWACAEEATLGGHLVHVALDSGDLLDLIGLPPGAQDGVAHCNDVAVSPELGVFTTDSDRGAVYVVDGGTATLAAEAMELSPSGMLGANGIVPSGSTLLVARFLPAALFRVDPALGTVAEVALMGDALRGGDGLAGPDGMVLDAPNGQRLFVAVGDQVKQVDLASAPALVTTLALRAEPGALSTLALAEGRVFAVKSFVRDFVLGTQRPGPFEILDVDAGL